MNKAWSAAGGAAFAAGVIGFFGATTNAEGVLLMIGIAMVVFGDEP